MTKPHRAKRLRQITLGFSFQSQAGEIKRKSFSGFKHCISFPSIKCLEGKHYPGNYRRKYFFSFLFYSPHCLPQRHRGLTLDLSYLWPRGHRVKFIMEVILIACVWNKMLCACLGVYVCVRLLCVFQLLFLGSQPAHSEIPPLAQSFSRKNVSFCPSLQDGQFATKYSPVSHLRTTCNKKYS